MHKCLPSNKALKSRSQSLRREMTPEEKHLWYDFLKNYEIQFYRQKVIGNYIVDFYCRRAKLAIEIDGAQHYESNAMEYDLRRTEYLNSEGIAVLRFLNGDVTQRFESVCAQIDLLVKERIIPHPSPDGDTFPKGEGSPHPSPDGDTFPKGKGSPHPSQSGGIGGFAPQKNVISSKKELIFCERK